jgi:hypothetical protein
MIQQFALLTPTKTQFLIQIKSLQLELKDANKVSNVQSQALFYIYFFPAILTVKFVTESLCSQEPGSEKNCQALGVTASPFPFPT